jgi:hypothetical protein
MVLIHLDVGQNHWTTLCLAARIFHVPFVQQRRFGCDGVVTIPLQGMNFEPQHSLIVSLKLVDIQGMEGGRSRPGVNFGFDV